MARKEFVMNLAKLLIAAAWADGELTSEEMNSLKDLLFTLPEVSGRQWKELEIYMDSPVAEKETERLLAAVVQGIRSSRDKALVLDTLRDLFESDGEVTPDEQALLDEVERAVAGATTSLFARMANAITSAIDRRTAHCPPAARRDARFDDYLWNTIYYKLQDAAEQTGTRIDRPDDEVRTLCLAAGLMARVAHVDEDISDDERRAMRKVVAADWGLSDKEADILVRISCDRTMKGLDYYRLSRGFYEHTTRAERLKFLRTLFRIANISEATSFEEIEQIRKIAKSLKLAHHEFIEAKLAVPKDDRKGL